MNYSIISLEPKTENNWFTLVENRFINLSINTIYVAHTQKILNFLRTGLPFKREWFNLSKDFGFREVSMGVRLFLDGLQKELEKTKIVSAPAD